MFSFAGASSPARSESVMSGASGWTGSSIANSPSRDATWTSQSGSPTSSVASFNTNNSSAAGGVKSRQIRDLRLDMELKDARINELEAAYDELERRAAFQQGETQCRLDEREREIVAMGEEQTQLQRTVADQARQLTEMQQTLAEFQTMTASFKAVMERCAALEALQRQKEREDAERREREHETERLAEVRRLALEEEARYLREEAEERARIQAAAEVALEEEAAAAEAQRVRVKAAACARPLPFKDRPSTATTAGRAPPQQTQQTRARRNDCAMM